MIFLLLAVGLIILALGLFSFYKISNTGYGSNKWYGGESWIYYILNSVGTVISIVSFIAAIWVGIVLSGRITIDEKIDLYRTENAVIEEQMETVIQNYQEFESGTLKEFNNESATILVSLYPELKSNELVAKQLEVYVNNNAKIKELECERLSYKPLAWWLYFGS